MFCAGGDLTWMKAQIGADRAQRLAEARKLAEMLQALNTLPVPLIGRMHGGAFGGGVGMAAVCDVAIAARGTKFCFSETRLGIIPATIARVVEAADLDAAVEAEVLPYLSTAPRAVAAAKALARALGPRIDAAVIDDSITRLADIWEGEEASPGIRAFLEKRPPPWG
jgi:methylglutaconyl-CoA hydratase